MSLGIFYSLQHVNTNKLKHTLSEISYNIPIKCNFLKYLIGMVKRKSVKSIVCDIALKEKMYEA